MPAARVGFIGLILAGSLGTAADLFDSRGDVGATKHPGSVEFDGARRAYTVAGGGANMWFTNDAFHFVWKKVSGDVTLGADITLVGPGGDPHRKACLLVRQNLEPNSAYADAALHGDGLASLQYRPASNERTYEIQSAISRPKRKEPGRSLARLSDHGSSRTHSQIDWTAAPTRVSIRCRR